MLDSPVRARLQTLAAERGRSLADLSLTIGRNANYLQQYITKGSPRRLPEQERRHLAISLEVDERLLGAMDPWTPPMEKKGRRSRSTPGQLRQGTS